MEPVIPNCEYKVYLEDRPETHETKATVCTLSNLEIYRKVYRSEKVALNAIKRRLKIDQDHANLLICKNNNGRWAIKGWR